MKIYVNYIVGINGDRIEVKVFDKDKMIRDEEYSYGYNASYNRKYARYAEKDYNDSIKYGWTTHGCLKPYIGELLVNLFKEYNSTKEEVEYSGYYVLPKRAATEEELKEIIKKLYAEL